jgi:hypothetical protein
MSNSKAFLLVAVILAMTINVTTISAEQEPYPNLAGDANFVNFQDFAVLADNWLKTGTGLAGDFDASEVVDFNDLKVFCDYWLEGPNPEDVFEQFKAALADGNIDGAVSYFAYFVADDYRNIFNENADKIPNMVSNMGTLSLEYKDRDIAVYEISNVDANEFYPVVFTQEDDGHWRIAVF